MSFKNLFYFICFISLGIEAKSIGLEDYNISIFSKNSTIKLALEAGVKRDFWKPGISGNVMKYTTEGLFLGFGKLKIKFHDNEVFTIEKYGTFENLENQNELLAFYEDNQKHESTIDGLRIGVELTKVINYLFDKEWLTGLRYEFNKRNFLGDATLLQNSKYWYGQLNNGVAGEDFSRLEVGTNLAFKTKFISHKLSYRFDDVVSFVKGDYFSLGLFDEEWSKPTFVGDTLNGEEPLIFDANYYIRGFSTSLGLEVDNYNIEAYLDYGIDTEMDIIQKSDNYSSLNKNIDMYRVGLIASYIIPDIYETSFFTTDIILNGEMEYSQLTEGGSSAIDAEQLYGVNMAIEITF